MVKQEALEWRQISSKHIIFLCKILKERTFKNNEQTQNWCYYSMSTILISPSGAQQSRGQLLSAGGAAPGCWEQYCYLLEGPWFHSVATGWVLLQLVNKPLENFFGKEKKHHYFWRGCPLWVPAFVKLCHPKCGMGMFIKPWPGNKLLFTN